MRRRTLPLAVLLAMACVAPAQAATPAAPYDFDGDGRQDLTNLVAPTASADFDRDGFADLAIGEDGAVRVLPGSADGLGSAPEVRLASADPADAGFGESLAAGDLDRDGFPDLAVGAPTGDPTPEEEFPLGSGRVHLFRGSAAGLERAASAVLRRGPRDDRFGAVLAIGDLDGDRLPELVSAYDRRTADDDSAVGRHGHLAVCAGTTAGPRACRTLRGRVAGSVAIGDVTGDGIGDLVAGTPQNGEADEGPGYVTLLAGTRAGLRPGQRFTQASRGVPGTNEFDDRFGAAVALADVDRDGHADLLVGAPGEDRGAGRVTFLRGSRAGVARTGARAWDQGTRGVPGTKERFDGFGGRLALRDHDGDRRLDLDVVAFGEDGFRGSVTTLPGVRGGFTTRGAQATPLERRGRDSNPR